MVAMDTDRHDDRELLGLPARRTSGGLAGQL